MISLLPGTPHDAPLAAQVAVVGSGLAGAEMMTFLAARGRDMIGSGCEGYERAFQSLYDADFAGLTQRTPG